jgi:hypothetical protein
MIHHLANRLPVMICPRWVYTRTQPIAIDDVLQYLVKTADQPETAGRTFDIGGPQVLTYRDLMLAVARVLGLKRLLIQVPVLTPRLSSYWVNLVTPIPAALARPLIEGLRHETVCEDNSAPEVYSVTPLPVETAIERALSQVTPQGVYDQPPEQQVDPSHLKTDTRVVPSSSDPERLFAAVATIGGKNGWYYADWLWRLRGLMDRTFGGVGLRRGRPRMEQLQAGDALDFWRVEEYVYKKRLLLRAEMKVWGKAWLDFVIEPEDSGGSLLVQTARYYPRGLIGDMYWYVVYPLHALVFRGMSKAIVRRAERSMVSERNQLSHGS